MTVPAPGTTVPLPISFGDIDTRLVPELRAALNSNADPWPAVTHNVQAFAEPELVVIDGVPHRDALRGARIASRVGVGSHQQVTSPLDPKTLQLGAGVMRWIPYIEYLDEPANGGRRWWPVGGNRTNESPRQSLYTINPAAATGRGTFAHFKSPYIDEGYTYSGYGRQMKRPAMIYDDQIAVSAIEIGATLPAVTLCFTAVLHPSPLTYYGLFEANQGGRGEPLVIRYSHGRVDVYQSHTRIVAHESHKPAHYPVIFMLAMDAATDTGRLMVLDRTRTTRTLNVAGLDFISLNGIIGALGQGTSASPWTRGSEMDLLELDIWPEALSFAQMEEKANLLSLAYGVAA